MCVCGMLSLQLRTLDSGQDFHLEIHTAFFLLLLLLSIFFNKQCLYQQTVSLNSAKIKKHCNCLLTFTHIYGNPINNQYLQLQCGNLPQLSYPSYSFRPSCKLTRLSPYNSMHVKAKWTKNQQGFKFDLMKTTSRGKKAFHSFWTVVCIDEFWLLFESMPDKKKRKEQTDRVQLNSALQPKPRLPELKSGTKDPLYCPQLWILSSTRWDLIQFMEC